MVNIIANAIYRGDPRRATMLKSMNTMYSLSGKWPKGNASPREKKKKKKNTFGFPSLKSKVAYGKKRSICVSASHRCKWEQH